MTGTQLKDILDGINVSLLRLNDRIDKLEIAQPEPVVTLSDGGYALSEGASWFDVRPFTVQTHIKFRNLVVQVYDEKAKDENDEALPIKGLMVSEQELNP